MKRVFLWATCGLLIAWTAIAQIKTTSDGGGISAPPAPQAGGQIPGASSARINMIYTFEGSPVPVSNPVTAPVGTGWWKIASSNLSEITGAAPVIMAAQSPMMTIEMQQNGSYMRVQERQFDNNGHARTNQHRNDEYRLGFNFTSNAGEAMTADSGVLEICVGDTSFVRTQKKPKGFGLIFVGSDHVNNQTFCNVPANWCIDKWIGFVGNGTDTTYIPLKAENLSTRDFWYIYAAPNGGPVSFSCNGVLLGTISDVTRDTGLDDNGLAISAEGGSDAQPEVKIGPISIERSW
jgi:hypothetical protein